MPEFLVIELLAIGIAFLLWLENRRAPRPLGDAHPTAPAGAGPGGGDGAQ